VNLIQAAHNSVINYFDFRDAQCLKKGEKSHPTLSRGVVPFTAEFLRHNGVTQIDLSPTDSKNLTPERKESITSSRLQALVDALRQGTEPGCHDAQAYN